MARQAEAARGKGVETHMRNVVYHYDAKTAVHIRYLDGTLSPTKGDVPVFDDKESFAIQITSAEIAISTDSLANVLNSYVLTKPDSPLKDVSIRAANGGRLAIKGRLHKKGNIPFETVGLLSATSDGKIRLHTEHIKAVHLPVKGLLDLLGIEVADLVTNGKVPGLAAEKDDLILDPQYLLPPPHIAGRVTAIRLEQNNIIQVFGTKGQDTSFRRAGNYMAYRGNQLRFGRLTMSDTDMILVDMDPGDPFDFYLDHYVDQLVAGYTKQTPEFGLRVYVRDYNKLKQTGTTGHRQPRIPR